ncbi:MAG: M48 family metallopeptidase [Pseudomonadota bacterium]
MARAPETFEGRYFDGESAVAAPAVATFEQGGVFVDVSAGAFVWPYRDIEKLDSGAEECRLGAKNYDDAVLVLPRAAFEALERWSPVLHGRAVTVKRMGGAIALMILAAAIVAGILFIGIPAASEPMARATPKGFETRIGSNMAAQIQTVFRTCATEESLQLIRPVIKDMAEKGDVGFPIEFEFVRTKAPNAFALPGGQVMATSGLLAAVGEDQEAFLAVMAHELGHVRGRDGLRAFYRNAGLGVLLEIVTGGSGLAQQAVLIGGQLAQLQHNREQEAAADDAAYEIMEASDLDPAALARAFEAITGYVSAENKDDNKSARKKRRDLPNWLRTHPDTGERIAAAKDRGRIDTNSAGEPKALPLTEAEWARVIVACDAPDEEDEDEAPENE